jgi:uncharacterized membrane protein (UPF0127 family)
MLLITAACAQECKFETLKIVGSHGSTHFTVEIADTPDAQQIGLMYRTEMHQNHGMLFVFNDMAHRSFWMKNTYLPLDLIYIDDNKVIKHIHKNAVPESLSAIPSLYPVQYVFEINAGAADQFNIQIGDRVEF